MNFDEVADEISSFWNKRDASWNDSNPVFCGGGQTEYERIQKLFNIELPAELKNYVIDMSPDKDFYFRTVGNDICIYSFINLSNKVDGFSYNPIDKVDIEGWNANWFLLGDQGGDPLIVDLSQAENSLSKCPVLQAMHGSGEWSFSEISSSISQFLLCAAYLQHALMGFEIDEVIIDKEDDLYLAEEVSQWFFPKVKASDPAHYDDWACIFKNSEEF